MKKLLLFLILLLTLDVQSQNQFEGYALYNQQNENTAYLIDKDGDIAHTWNCDLACNYTVLLKNNGNIVRGAKNPNNTLAGAAEGGRVQEIAPDGSIIWEFTYSDASHLSHHDITIVNDNVLLTAWEVKSPSELTLAGYDDASDDKWPTHFVEVAHDGNGGGEIVWEWHLWDHIIQDHDSSKDNFGVVAEHPELININMLPEMGGGNGPGGNSGDWFHINGVNYNANLDQIAFSSRHASEVYIIDHSTTSEEAATHLGGNSNQGGDLLYRWGNPSNYGAPGAQQIPNAVNDVRWITNDGRPNGGFLQFYNNNGGGSSTSSVDAIETPRNGFNYDLVPGQAYEPTSSTWSHTCEGYASGQSSQNRMSNGNTFVNMSGGQGGSGYMYESDADGNFVWVYNVGGTPKAFRYECDDPGIIALIGNIEIESDCTTLIVEGCTDNTALNYDEIANTDDGSCIVIYFGCTDPTACNYNPDANTDDASCIYGAEYAFLNSIMDSYNLSSNNAFTYFQQGTVTTDNTSIFVQGSSLFTQGTNLLFYASTSILITITSSLDGLFSYYDDNQDLYDCSGNCINDIYLNGLCDELELLGCTSDWADNYDEFATDDDGSCELVACNYPYFFEYDSNYTISDPLLCTTLIVEGCTNSNAENYNEEANLDDGSCVVFGCMNEEAENYNPDATIQDNSCVYYGCTNQIAENYNEQATDNDGSCIIYGCVLSVFPNYNPEATTDDNSCSFDGLNIYGCTDDNALNYISQANTDNGSCLYQDNVNCSISIQEEDIPLYLPEGWVLFGYTCLEPLDLSLGFESIVDVVIIVKDSDGNAYLPEWNFNGIGDLQYSRGYQIKLTQEITDFQFCPAIVPLVDSDGDGVYDVEEIEGCMNISACNYNPEANTDDGSCVYPEQGYDCEVNITEYVVGMEAEGGIVFYVDETGQHGLVAALEDGEYEWGCYLEYVEGAEGQAIGTGYQNTLDVVAQNCQTQGGGITASQAALSYETEGYIDWYLPSKDELLEMYNTIGNGDPEGNIGGFENNYYWSSSEYNGSFAWYVNFNDGGTLDGSKVGTGRVRVIRAF